MVVATAQSIKDYQAHYDEVADKKQFHKSLPLSNYQKIVDGVDEFEEPTISQSTISLQSQLQANALPENQANEPTKQVDPEPKEAPQVAAPKQSLVTQKGLDLPEPTPVVLENPITN